MELGTLIRIGLRRLPLIMLVAVLCAAAAWAVARPATDVYSLEVSFLLRPAGDLPVAEANRAAGTLADRESAVTQTIVGLLGSEPSVVPGSTPPATERTVTLRPGSTIIDVELQGGDQQALQATARRYDAAAPQLVSGAWRVYELRRLGSEATPTKVPSSLWRTVVLALLVGGAFGWLVLAVLEHRLRGGGREASDAELLRAVPPETPVRPGRADA